MTEILSFILMVLSAILGDSWHHLLPNSKQLVWSNSNISPAEKDCITDCIDRTDGTDSIDCCTI